MKKLLQINTVINSGSTGHIAETIGELVIKNGWESYIAYGRNPRNSLSKTIKIGNKLDILFHVFLTRFFDMHGLASIHATKRLVKNIKKIKPDLIQLHNIHGYYLNYKVLFRFLAKSGIPVVWTMHDCWPITGHCVHYSYIGCEAWKSFCVSCPQLGNYPKTRFLSNTKNNYKCKKNYFNLLNEKQLTIVTPSKWLSNEISKSYLGHFQRKVIYNGVNTDIFTPLMNYEIETTQIILGVASVWDDRKGLNDFFELSEMLHEDEEIVLIGVSEKIISKLPKNIKGIRRTESKEELAQWYSKALVYFNASVEETFGMTCAEAQACGTPVIAYNSTALPETFNEKTGILIEPNNIKAVYEAIEIIRERGKAYYSDECRTRAVALFDEKKNFMSYLNLYTQILNNK